MHCEVLTEGKVRIFHKDCGQDIVFAKISACVMNSSDAIIGQDTMQSSGVLVVREKSLNEELTVGGSEVCHLRKFCCSRDR